MPPSRRRTPFPGRRSGPRRKLVWATLNTAPTITANGHVVLEMLGNLRVAGASVLGATVMRTHLSCGLFWAATTEFYQVGLIVGRLEDVGTTVLDPNTNPGEDWMFNQQVFAHASGATVDAASWAAFDVRSKRKMEELDQTYLLSLHFTGAANKSPQLYARTLIALA